jgi:flagellar motor switch protein FliN/FliY
MRDRSTEADEQADKPRMPAELSAILKLEVPVVVEIARRSMRLSDVLNLAPGAILELPKLADEELQLRVNNKPIGAGRAVKVGENFGMRLTFVGNLTQRVKALAAPGLSTPGVSAPGLPTPGLPTPGAGAPGGEATPAAVAPVAAATQPASSTA